MESNRNTFTGQVALQNIVLAKDREKESESIMWDKTPEDKTKEKKGICFATVAFTLALNLDGWVVYNARSFSG